MSQYRYIACGTAKLTDRVCEFRLIGASNLTPGMSHYIRIQTDGVALEKCACDAYSTTEDQRTLAELNGVPMIRLNGRPVQVPELAKWPLHVWYERLRDAGAKATMTTYRSELTLGAIRKALAGMA